MSDPTVAHHKAKHLLSHVLAAAGAKRWPGVMIGESGETPTGFYADFGHDAALAESELAELSEAMARLLNQPGRFHPVRWTPPEATRVFRNQPWQQVHARVLAEQDFPLDGYDLDGFVDLCSCRLKDRRELAAVHPERFVLTGAMPVLWQDRSVERWFIRVVGELFPTPPACPCC